jgi:hypothetical protein
LIEKHFPAPDRSRIQQMLAKQGDDLLQLFFFVVVVVNDAPAK